MSIAKACLLTVLIETPFLALCGYKSKTAITIIVCTNIITNLVMNVILALAFPHWTMQVLLAAETMVVAAEYLIYSIPFGRGWKLLMLTLAANVLSCGIGLLVMR